MLYTLAVLLLIAWLLGVVGTYTIGAFVHVLLVIAIVLFLVGLTPRRLTGPKGRRVPEFGGPCNDFSPAIGAVCPIDPDQAVRRAE